MKLTPDVIEKLEHSDAYFLICVKGQENATSAQGIHSDKEKTIQQLVGGLLGVLDKELKIYLDSDPRGSQNGNGIVLLVFVTAAIKMFSIFKNLLLNEGSNEN